MRVSDVLDALAAGAGFDELLADFSYLSREDVLACLAYGARCRSFGGPSRLMMRILIDATSIGRPFGRTN